jgi:hypothetical protein
MKRKKKQEMERKNMKAGTDKNLQRAEAEDKKERQLLH